MKIRLNAGHGPGREYNRGAIGFNEGDKNYEMCGKLMTYMRNTYQPIDISEIRHERGNRDYDLATRANYGDGADLYLAWHTNAFNGSARGIEIWISVTTLEYRKFAEELAEAISKLLDTPNRGVRTRTLDYQPQADWYGELREADAKCELLIEFCFHDNAADARAYLAKADQLVKLVGDMTASKWGLKRKVSAGAGGKQTLVPTTVHRIFEIQKEKQIDSYRDKARAEAALKRYKAQNRKVYMATGKAMLKPTSAPANRVKYVTYTVKYGDTLSEIAARYKQDYKQIAKDNGIKNPDELVVGQKLRIKVEG